MNVADLLLPMMLVSKTWPSSAVTEWPAVSLFLKVTIAPGSTVRLVVVKAKLLASIVSVVC